MFVAIFGLTLSSFSLMVIQGVMRGLQGGLIQRSKNVLGDAIMQVPYDFSQEQLKNLYLEISALKIHYFPEMEVEVLVKNGDYLAPVLLRGIDFDRAIPNFLKKKDISGIVLGGDLASKTNTYFHNIISVISPAHTDAIFGDIPRSVTEESSDFYISELPEIDGVTGWTRLALVQNLIREERINQIRFYSVGSMSKLETIAKKNDLNFKTWEEMNQTLVWALNLETSVMIFLFAAMSFLVSIAITSGFMIFFDKVKPDLISFWILGRPRKEIFLLGHHFAHCLSIGFSLLGVLLGIGVLLLLKYHQINFMPDFFVEKSIPVEITAFNVTLSFLIPYSIAAVFSRHTLNVFKKENQNFVSVIRQVGR